MTVFGGFFQSPELEGIESSGENGERGRVVGLDLDRGVVRVRPPRDAVADVPPTDDVES